ncbi:MAG: hypothetical protein HYW49_00815, partial [Deltaproteobacteria bacterium]|nr:hypothetical protein [Deltaproteobacteria bacterium]
KEIFANPLHPYTRGLLSSLPSLEKKKRLETIAGIVPSLLELPKGCRFQTRCPHVFELCRGEEPELREVAHGHWIACYKDLQRRDAGIGRRIGLRKIHARALRSETHRADRWTGRVRRKRHHDDS